MIGERRHIDSRAEPGCHLFGGGGEATGKVVFSSKDENEGKAFKNHQKEIF